MDNGAMVYFKDEALGVTLIQVFRIERERLYCPDSSHNRRIQYMLAALSLCESEDMSLKINETADEDRFDFSTRATTWGFMGEILTSEYSIKITNEVLSKIKIETFSELNQAINKRDKTYEEIGRGDLGHNIGEISSDFFGKVSRLIQMDWVKLKFKEESQA